jgi:hypothetical protein
MTDDAIRRFALAVRDAAERLLSDLASPEGVGEAGNLGGLHSPDGLKEELIRLVPGVTQKAVLGLSGLYDVDGMSTEDVRGGISVAEVAQAFQTLQRLRARGLVEEVPDMKPKRWRIAERYRRRLVTGAPS